MEVTEKPKSSYYSLSYWDKHPTYSPYCSYEKSSWITYLTKCSKCNTFQVISDLLNSDNLKVAITQLCHELQVWNFTVL